MVMGCRRSVQQLLINVQKLLIDGVLVRCK
jgi:hypothetical protein